ncbi:hypothetical protein [Streptomyces crystallinus]|uniref:Translation initiation factor IF-2 n=1 Tax=Streptomyces crystallinus TaxID=68191 RepID=A0ABN1GD16_9ACTN
MELNVGGGQLGNPRVQDRMRAQALPESEVLTQVQPQVQIQPPSTGADPDGPVFVDESGRRGKNLRRLGWVFGLACTCYAVMLVGSLLGGSSRAPWLGIPGPAAKEKKTETVQVTPAPTDPRATRPAAKPSGPAKSRTHPPAVPGHAKASGTPKPARKKTSGKPTTASPHPAASQSAKPTGGRTAGPGLPTGSSGSPTGLSANPTPPSGAST